jgi:energy-converting hydrogenase Eha subunit B
VLAAALLAVLAVFVAAAIASTTYATIGSSSGRVNAPGVHSQSITTLNSGSGWWLQGFHYAGGDYYESCSVSCSSDAGAGYGIPASTVWCAGGAGSYSVSCKYP